MELKDIGLSETHGVRIGEKTDTLESKWVEIFATMKGTEWLLYSSNLIDNALTDLFISLTWNICTPYGHTHFVTSFLVWLKKWKYKRKSAYNSNVSTYIHQKWANLSYLSTTVHLGSWWLSSVRFKYKLDYSSCDLLENSSALIGGKSI